MADHSWLHASCHTSNLWHHLWLLSLLNPPETCQALFLVAKLCNYDVTCCTAATKQLYFFSTFLHHERNGCKTSDQFSFRHQNPNKIMLFLLLPFEPYTVLIEQYGCRIMSFNLCLNQQGAKTEVSQLSWRKCPVHPLCGWLGWSVPAPSWAKLSAFPVLSDDGMTEEQNIKCFTSSAFTW